MKVVIFGATGGIGSNLVKIYKKQNQVTALSRSDFDFTSTKFKTSLKSRHKFNQILDDSDLIINASGVLGDLNGDYQNVFDVNFNSNWLIIRHFIKHPVSSPKKVIFIGSSVYKKGRDDIMLYAASKAALFSLYKSAKKYFKSSKITIGLINPKMVNTNMVKKFNGRKMEAKECSMKIYNFINNLERSKYVDFN